MNRRTYLTGIATGATASLAGFATTKSAEGSEQWHGTYEGPASVSTYEVQYATDEISGYLPEESATVPATVSVTPPLSTDENTETNPVYVQAIGLTDLPGGEGEFVITSSGIFSTQDYPAPAVVQAWNFRLEGETLAGTLKQNATIVSNFFFTRVPPPPGDVVDLGIPVPFSLLYATQFRATRTSGGLSVVVDTPVIGTETRPADQRAFAVRMGMELRRQ
ncbi:hypothetical protein [Natronorubrum sp. DTA28]|uniref:hypothetical protein n=1 Tax=Natronorubrum sp. DTA28 TaxID=3447019 RepID=UPI003F830CCC